MQFQVVGRTLGHMRNAVYVFRFATPRVPFGQAGCLHELPGLGAVGDLQAVSYMYDIDI
jgi:hypothetical protein